MNESLRAAIEGFRLLFGPDVSSALEGVSDRLAELFPADKLDLEIARQMFAADERTKYAVLALAYVLGERKLGMR